MDTTNTVTKIIVPVSPNGESNIASSAMGTHNMDFIMVSTYEENGENPELVIYKKR